MDVVTIPKSEYDHLMRHRRMIEALLDNGMNNWEGYYEAMQVFWEQETDDYIRSFVLVDPREYDAAVEDAALYRDLCT